MRAIHTALFTACSLSMVFAVSAQPFVSPPAPVVGAPDVLDVGPDEEVLVREYVIRRRPVVVAPPPVVTAPAPVISEPVAIIRPGSIIPADVELEPFVDAPIPALRRYSYFISPSNKIVVVEPVGRRVVRVLER